MSFDQQIKKMKQLFSRYSVQDVVYSLFVSHLWLPNLASSVQDQFFVAVFLTMKPTDFSTMNRIREYKHFKEFCTELYSIPDGFPSLEDYLPSFDWGDIKYAVDAKLYKFFYGGVGNMYDLIKAFDMTHAHLDDSYRSVTGRSPKKELLESLQFQTDLIDSINSQPKPSKLERVNRGELAVPTKIFWTQTVKYLKAFRPQEMFSQNFSENFSIKLGDFDNKKLEYQRFCNDVMTGKLFRHFFVYVGGNYYPIIPRLHPIMLIDIWSEIYEKFSAELEKKDVDFQKDLTFEIAYFLKARFHKSEIFPIISAVDNNMKRDDVVFAAVVISGNRLVCFYSLHPFNTSDEAQKELVNIRLALDRTVKLLKRKPLQLADHINQVIMELHGDKDLTPEIFFILPQMNTAPQPIVIPKTTRGNIIFLDQFIAIMDELNNVDELSKFLDYYNDYKKNGLMGVIGLVDIFASFRAVSGILIEGAVEPDFISINEHWGADWRYESLAKFWRAWPSFKLHEDPRTLMLSPEKDRIRFVQKSDNKQNFILIKTEKVNGWTASPLYIQDWETASVSNLFMECIEDYFAKNSFLGDHPFFEHYEEFQVHFFPKKVVDESGKLEHLKHLVIPEGRWWVADHGFPLPCVPGIRIVIDTEKLHEDFITQSTNEIEIELLKEVFQQIHEIYPHNATVAIFKQLNALKGRPPRFKSFAIQKEVSFPDVYPVHKPGIYEHKRARKEMAKIALSHGFRPKSYTREAAKSKLKTLKDSMVGEVNRIVSGYDFVRSLPFLLSSMDGLINERQMKKLRLKHSLEHEVDYDRGQLYAEIESEFIVEHRNYRYLVEKFLQLKPSGEEKLSEDGLKYLLAVIDKILEIQSASDALHYEIYPLSVKVTHDFVIEIRYKENIDARQRDFSEENGRLSLGTIGKEADRLNDHSDLEVYLDSLDKHFLSDYGFQLKNMIAVLAALSSWAANTGSKEEACYSSGIEEIKSMCAKVIKDFGLGELNSIIDFLTLDNEKLLYIKGSSTPASDLPVWEHTKRIYRYGIQPLIKIDKTYYWAPYSTYLSAGIWMNAASDGVMPADLAGPSIRAFLKKENEKTEKLLEIKTTEITKRFTPYAERVNYTRGTHPQEVGEYDTLAYLKKENILLNIECKDMDSVYCLKDAKRLKEKIFRSEGKNKGNLLKVEVREKYLRDNLQSFKDKLGWPIKKNPTIISLYVSKRYYWWTKYPPRDTSVTFLRLDLLDDYLKNLMVSHEE